MADETNAAGDPSQPVPPSDESLPALSYEAPRDRIERDPPVNVLGITTMLFIGSAVSVAGVFFGGMLLVNLVMSIHDGEKTVGRIVAGAIGFAFFVLVLVAIWQTSRKFKSKKLRETGTWLVIGLLIGCGITCLIEGICFSVVGVGG